MAPLDILLGNLEALREAYAGDPTHAKALERFIEATGSHVTLNTFKQLAPAVLATAERLASEVANLRTELAKVTQERDELAMKLDTTQKEVSQTVIHPVSQEVSHEPPKSFEGWSVQTDKKGYTRLYKKTAGKVRSVYVGRVWNEGKARAAIEKATQRCPSGSSLGV